jgi:hypothetical protein
VANQQLTLEWWQYLQPQVHCWVSPFVMEEISSGHPEVANRRLQMVSHLPMLSVNEEIKKLADTYFVAISLPERARLDASHLAMAVWHQMDYLLSWNCKHIVSARVRQIVQDLNQPRALSTPIICTPAELMEV